MSARTIVILALLSFLASFGVGCSAQGTAAAGQPSTAAPCPLDERSTATIRTGPAPTGEPSCLTNELETATIPELQR